MTIDTFPINCPSSESYTKGIVDLNVNTNLKFDKGRSMVSFSKSRDIHVIFLYSYMHIKIKVTFTRADVGPWFQIIVI